MPLPSRIELTRAEINEAKKSVGFLHWWQRNKDVEQYVETLKKLNGQLKLPPLEGEAAKVTFTQDRSEMNVELEFRVTDSMRGEKNKKDYQAHLESANDLIKALWAGKIKPSTRGK